MILVFLAIFPIHTTTETTLDKAYMLYTTINPYPKTKPIKPATQNQLNKKASILSIYPIIF